MFFHKDTIERFPCLSSCRFSHFLIFIFVFSSHSSISAWRGHGSGGLINEFLHGAFDRDNAYGIKRKGSTIMGVSSLAMYRTANPERRKTHR